MDNKYFDDLAHSINEPNGNKRNDINSTATLTIKVDIDAKIYCDGDFLDLAEANKVKKIPIETGQHLITVESEHYDNLSEDHVIDAIEAGKNYLLLVNGMKHKEQEYLQKEKEEERCNERKSELEKLVCDFKEKEREGAEKIILKRNTTIEYLSHEILVDLFSTTFERAYWMSSEYDKDFYNSLGSKNKKGDCFEDHLADVLLNGGDIYLFDECAKGEIHGKNGEVIEGDCDGTVMYTINLQDVIQGLENALNGNFKTSDLTTVAYVRECAEALADEDSDDPDEDSDDLDITADDTLMQVIMFNAVIYI